MRSRFLVALALALMGAACDNSAGGDTTPTTVAGPQTTETFRGMVDPGGIDVHTFTIMQPGEIDVVLTATDPPFVMGVGLGTPSASSTCTLQLTGNAQAGTTTQLQPATASFTGTACVAVYAIVNQTATVNYTVTVAHP